MTKKSPELIKIDYEMNQNMSNKTSNFLKNGRNWGWPSNNLFGLSKEDQKNLKSKIKKQSELIKRTNYYEQEEEYNIGT